MILYDLTNHIPLKQKPVLIFMENLNEGLKNDLIMDLTFPDVGDGLGKMKNIGLIRFHKYDLTVPNQVRDHVEATASNQTEGLFYDPMFPQDFPEKCNMENFYFQHIAKVKTKDVR